MNRESRQADPVRSVFAYAGLLLIACLGVWGCGKKPTEAATLERARALESRCVQLEQDYRLVTQARDRARLELGEAQGQIAAHLEALKEIGSLRIRLQASLAGQEQLRALAERRCKERDELAGQLAMRMTERQALTSRCEKLRNGLRSLLQDDGVPGGPSE